MSEVQATRDHSVFDAELAGKAFDGRLLRRLLHWLGPHWRWAAWSAALVMVASVLAILMPVIVTRVVIDGLLVSVAGERYILPSELASIDQILDWLADLTGRSRPPVRIPAAIIGSLTADAFPAVVLKTIFAVGVIFIGSQLYFSLKKEERRI